MEDFEKLKIARMRIGITQEYVARQLGIPRTAVVQIENGSRKITSGELAILCDLYGLSADYVLKSQTVDTTRMKFIARSFDSLSAEDQQEIASLIEFKRVMAERKRKQQKE
ncbi:MAG: helix-turn-helix domain-containing protein [Sphaerochaetaceae bacterium]|nr:helix-turn-helix domain-containing protein [Sphaerochaetaceae bacterium]